MSSSYVAWLSGGFIRPRIAGNLVCNPHLQSLYYCSFHHDSFTNLNEWITHWNLMQYPDINMSSRGISWSYVARSEFLVKKKQYSAKLYAVWKKYRRTRADVCTVLKHAMMTLPGDVNKTCCLYVWKWYVYICMYVSISHIIFLLIHVSLPTFK